MRHASGPVIATFIAGPLLLSILYILSVGPAVRVHQHFAMSDEAAMRLETFYMPVIFAAENVPGLERKVQWYVSLWEVAPPPGRPLPAPTASLPTPSPVAAPRY